MKAEEGSHPCPVVVVGFRGLDLHSLLLLKYTDAEVCSVVVGTSFSFLVSLFATVPCGEGYG